MKVAIMQPYFFPYIGYFQLINAVDTFVIYDNIEYTKKGWINRNRILVNGKVDYFSIPLKKDSDYLNIVNRELSNEWQKEKTKILNRIKENYQKTPFFCDVFPLIERCFNCKEINLFEFLLFSIQEIMEYLSIETEIVVSSTIATNHNLKSEDKVIAICKELQAKYYYNPIGGLELYSKKTFENNSINLRFLKTNNYTYMQFGDEFEPFLSIIDVMMFHSKEALTMILNNEFILIA